MFEQRLGPGLHGHVPRRLRRLNLRRTRRYVILDQRRDLGHVVLHVIDLVFDIASFARPPPRRPPPLLSGCLAGAGAAPAIGVF